MYNKISLACDNNEFAINIISISKAFDMLNHNILLRKLLYYGVCGIAQDWLLAI